MNTHFWLYPLSFTNVLSFPNNHIMQIEEGDFAASLGKTEKLEEEKKLLRAELNRCVEKVLAFLDAVQNVFHANVVLQANIWPVYVCRWLSFVRLKLSWLNFCKRDSCQTNITKPCVRKCSRRRRW